MPIYMKYDGIDGSVTAAGHDKWIELNSCQMGVGRGITMAVGKGTNREGSAPSVSEIVVTKDNDAASPKLFNAALQGEGKKVIIDFCKTDGGKVEPYLTFTLENTLISSYSASGSGGSQTERPMESLSLNFTKIEFKNTPMKSANEPGSPETVIYNLAEAKIG